MTRLRSRRVAWREGGPRERGPRGEARGSGHDWPSGLRSQTYLPNLIPKSLSDAIRIVIRLGLRFFGGRVAAYPLRLDVAKRLLAPSGGARSSGPLSGSPPSPRAACASAHLRRRLQLPVQLLPQAVSSASHSVGARPAASCSRIKVRKHGGFGVAAGLELVTSQPGRPPPRAGCTPCGCRRRSSPPRQRCHRRAADASRAQYTRPPSCAHTRRARGRPRTAPRDPPDVVRRAVGVKDHRHIVPPHRKACHVVEASAPTAGRP